jgi:hypothetical protein
MELSQAAYDEIAKKMTDAGYTHAFIGNAMIVMQGIAVTPQEEPHFCSACGAPFKDDDLCATDIELGICHAACLEGSPVVDLETGDEKPDATITTFLFKDADKP